VSDTEKHVLRALETYKEAVFAKDAERLMQLYAPDVRVFDMWGTWSCEGAAAWRVTVEGWLSSLGTERVRVTFNDVQVVAAQGFAAVSAIATYTAISAQGLTLRSLQNRLSWVLRTSGHVLRIVHEHTSAPIGFEDTKAILKRDITA